MGCTFLGGGGLGDSKWQGWSLSTRPLRAFLDPEETSTWGHHAEASREVAQTTDSGSTTAASILVWSAKWTPVELEPTFLPTYFNKLFPFLSTREEGRKALSNKVGPLWRNPNIKDMKVALEIRGYYYDHLVPRTEYFIMEVEVGCSNDPGTASMWVAKRYFHVWYDPHSRNSVVLWTTVGSMIRKWAGKWAGAQFFVHLLWLTISQVLSSYNTQKLTCLAGSDDFCPRFWPAFAWLFSVLCGTSSFWVCKVNSQYISWLVHLLHFWHCTSSPFLMVPVVHCHPMTTNFSRGRVLKSGVFAWIIHCDGQSSQPHALPAEPGPCDPVKHSWSSSHNFCTCAISNNHLLHHTKQWKPGSCEWTMNH